MAKGGVRKNAGRPSGAPNTGVTVPPSARAAVQDAMAKRLEGLDITPLEIMLMDAKFQYDETRKIIDEANEQTDKAKRAKLIAEARASSRAASYSASAVAPYVHSKLNSVTLKGDAENPLEIALGLTSSTDLKKLIRGG